MKNIYIFIKVYWQHAKGFLDITLFIVSLVALFLGIQTTLDRYMGLVLIFVTVLIASYRTWLYQYRQTQDLIESQGKEIEFDDLNNIQKSIIIGINNEIDKKIISVGTLSGVSFIGLGDIDNNYSNDEIGAEIAELEKMGILRVDNYNKSGRPIYKPTSCGFRILKQINNQ